MTLEILLLEKWRSLPFEKQQEVYDFVEFLQYRHRVIDERRLEPKSKSELDAKLQRLRRQIVSSGIPLLTDGEIDLEIAERRGGYQELE